MAEAEKTWVIDWSMVDVDVQLAPDGDHDIESYSGYALLNGKRIKAWGNDEQEGFQTDLVADIAEEAAEFLGKPVSDAMFDKILNISVTPNKKTTITAKGGKVTVQVERYAKSEVEEQFVTVYCEQKVPDAVLEAIEKDWADDVARVDAKSFNLHYKPGQGDAYLKATHEKMLKVLDEHLTPEGIEVRELAP